MAAVRRRAVRGISFVPLGRCAIRPRASAKRLQVPIVRNVTPTMIPTVRRPLPTISVLDFREKRAKSWEIIALWPVVQILPTHVPRVMHVKRWMWTELPNLYACAIARFRPLDSKSSPSRLGFLKSRHSCHVLHPFTQRLHSDAHGVRAFLLSRYKKVEICLAC